MKKEHGFTLLEVLVATAIAGIAVAGLMGAISNTANNANRLTGSDRAALIAKSRMDELLADYKLPRAVPIEGQIDPMLTGGVPAGWRARVTAFEGAPNTGPGMWIVDRIELEIWWMDGATRHAFTLEAFRRGIL